MMKTVAAAAALAASALAHADVKLDEQVTWASPAAPAGLPEGVDFTRKEQSGESPEDLVVQSREVSIHISRDTIDYERTRIYRYDSIEAVRDYGNIYVGFDAATDSVIVEHALIVDSRGILHAVDPSTVQIVPNDTDLIFSDSTSVVIPLAGLDLGATALVKDKVTHRRDKNSGPWSAALYEQYGVVQENVVFDISWSEPSLRPDWRTELDGMECSETDNRVYCRAQDVAPYPVGEDAYYDDVVPHFWVSESESWAEISSWYQPLFASAISNDESIATMARKLSANLDDETEKLRSIHEFVAGDIRYVGLEHGESAYVPKPSAVTLERRYGDCKDKAALLVDLAAQVGIQMSPVLVSTERQDLERLALPAGHIFDHLIVCGALSNGREYCLDPTDPYTGIDELSGWVQGAVALPVNETGGPIELPSPTYSWTVRETLDLNIDDKGALTEAGRIEYGGAYGASIRSSIAGMTSEELSDWALDDYQSTVSDAVEPTFEVTGVESTRGPVVVAWTATYADMVPLDENLRYSEIAAWLGQTIGYVTTENEHFDYRFGGVDFESTINVRIDDRWQMHFAGPDISFEHEAGEFTRSYDMSPQTLRVDTRFHAPANVISIEDATTFNDFIDAVIRESMVRVNGNLSEP